MAIYVNTNVQSLTAQRKLDKSQNSATKSLQRLSTGLRINSAADDAAGLAISEKLKSQTRSLEQAQRNANDGVSLTQTAEAGVEQMQGILGRMRELSVQSSNGTLSSSDREFLNDEFSSLRTELDRIADTTEFNGIKLLQGSASAGVDFQIGINDSANDRITVKITSSRSDDLGGTAASLKLDQQSISQASKAQDSLASIDKAINQLSSVRSGLGSSQNRLSISVDNLGSTVENLAAANQRIRDVDVAKETANLTKSQILVQAGLSVLAQANQSPQIALSLIG